jgi:hypothetical protein
LDPATIPQKAGCHPNRLCKVVLKELVDNQLDATGQATPKRHAKSNTWIVSGSGDGPPLSAIPKLFSVNRPLVSSKLKRTISRGLLGNGLRVVMGAVHALNGSIVVVTRGHKLTLAVDPADGTTKIVKDQAITDCDGKLGMQVRINLGEGSNPEDELFAKEAIDAAGRGKFYTGPSSPWWYGPRDLHMLFSAAPPSATVHDVLNDLGLEYHEDSRQAKTLTYEDCKTLLQWLRAAHKSILPEKLGKFGQEAYGYDGYGYKVDEMTTAAGAYVPYVVEAWASATASPKKGVSEVSSLILFVNRTRAVASLYGSAASGGIRLLGCGMNRGSNLRQHATRSF